MNITTSYNIGDEFWVMYKNKPEKVNITFISATIQSRTHFLKTTVTTKIEYVGSIQYGTNITFTEGDIVYRTKADLLASLV